MHWARFGDCSNQLVGYPLIHKCWRQVTLLLRSQRVLLQSHPGPPKPNIKIQTKEMVPELLQFCFSFCVQHAQVFSGWATQIKNYITKCFITYKVSCMTGQSKHIIFFYRWCVGEYDQHRWYIYYFLRLRVHWEAIRIVRIKHRITIMNSIPNITPPFSLQIRGTGE